MPLLEQYFRAKAAHPGALLAMRVGDFYEFYGEDAEVAARLLEITLTGRDDGKNGRVAMAGVPYHSVEKYLARLLAKGVKVALCDQMEDPKQAKGLVRREVTRVLSPGTVLEDSMLPERSANFLAAIAVDEAGIGLAILDSSTGEFLATELAGDDAGRQLSDELGRLRPAELLHEVSEQEAGVFIRAELIGTATRVALPTADRACRSLAAHFGARDLSGYGLDAHPQAIRAAAAVIEYAEGNGLNLAHVDGIAVYSLASTMTIDAATRRSLELTANLTDGGRAGTLLEELDRTRTASGARLLRRWIDAPLRDAMEIAERYGAVGRLLDGPGELSDLRDALERMADVERLVARSAAALASPRDLVALRETLAALPAFAAIGARLADPKLSELFGRVDPHTELAATLSAALVDEPPAFARDGGFVRDGYDAEIDRLRGLSRQGRDGLVALEAQERKATGITTLKVGYNSVFGYYLEVGKAHSAKVPAHYVRKQTTTNAERYITADLKEYEASILGAGERATQLELEVFGRLRAEVTAAASGLLRTARAIAEIDVLASLADVARLRDYVRPELAAEDGLVIRSGRHPVVEAHVSGFVPNDLTLDEGTRHIVLTGPNMSGKSTYLRQAALIVLMAQVGSFVPAQACRLSPCDRIFARIGARDDLATGQSTFMVEMLETANILNNATERSLVILDEVGRGTSTFDGMAIAWAVAERLAQIGAKTLFATHYHQLNALAEQLPTVANFRLEVRELGDEVVWTHRVLPGGTDRSYGIHVARMAGVPAGVLARAGEVLADLEGSEETPRAIGSGGQTYQLRLFELADSPVLAELRELAVEELTPVQALVLLESWKRRIGASTS